MIPTDTVMDENTPKVNEIIGFTAPELLLWKMTELAKDLEIQVAALKKERSSLESSVECLQLELENLEHHKTEINY